MIIDTTTDTITIMEVELTRIFGDQLSSLIALHHAFPSLPSVVDPMQNTVACYVEEKTGFKVKGNVVFSRFQSEGTYIATARLEPLTKKPSLADFANGSVDVSCPEFHDIPLWLVHGTEDFPQLLLCKVKSYPSGQNAIWGYTAHQGKPGFRTLGLELNQHRKRSPVSFFFIKQDCALAFLKKITALPECLTQQGKLSHVC